MVGLAPAGFMSSVCSCWQSKIYESRLELEAFLLALLKDKSVSCQAVVQNNSKSHFTALTSDVRFSKRRLFITLPKGNLNTLISSLL